MSWPGLLSQLLEIVLAHALAPLLSGWVNQWRAWLQNKSAPSLLQPYRMLHKLFNKESVVADNASRLFRAAPYVVFGCMLLACAIVPTLSTDLPLAPAADAIALVGLCSPGAGVHLAGRDGHRHRLRHAWARGARC
jgi:formate hydrogenlyase subunit 4